MNALDARLSLFERVDRPRGQQSKTTLRSFLSAVRRGDFAEPVAAVRAAPDAETRKARKLRLPALTPCGDFAHRAASGLRAHSGLVVLDVDDARDLPAVRGFLEAHPNVTAAFVSPSGTGYKVFVPFVVVDPETGEHRPPCDDTEHKAAWAYVAARFETGPCAGLVDASGKDVARACYASHDPEAYVNDSAVPVVVPLSPPPLPQGATLPRGSAPADSARVESALAFLGRAGRLPYDEWVRLISAVLDAVGGDAQHAEALLVRHIGEDTPGEYADKLPHALERVTAGTLFHLAREAGWMESRDGRRHTEPIRAAPPAEHATAAPVPLGVCVADVEPEAVRWMWQGRLSLGKVHLLDGDPGTGKSTIYAFLAACLTAGVPWPDGSPVPASARGGVVIVTAEDDVGTTIRPRLEAAGADISRVSVVTLVPTPNGAGRMPRLPDDVDLLIAECERIGARLLVLDPVTAYLGDINSHRDSDVRGGLAPLAEAAERAGVAVLLVRHLNKGAGSSALYRGGGSIAFSGLARVVLLAGRVPDDDDRRALAVAKNNLAPFAPTLGYHIESAGPFSVGHIVWHGPVPLTADDLVRPLSGSPPTPARDDAADFLLGALAVGPRLAREVYEEAEAEGIAKKTLQRAKALLGVVAERRGGVAGSGAWYWLLPAGIAVGTPGGHAKGVSTPDPGPLSGASGDGHAGTPPRGVETPKEAERMAPLGDGYGRPPRGPLSEIEVGSHVKTPEGPGVVTNIDEKGAVSVTVDDMHYLFIDPETSITPW